MQNTALVLMSCAHCQRLHEPSTVDTSHPVCQPCASVATRPPQTPFPFRPLAR